MPIDMTKVGLIPTVQATRTYTAFESKLCALGVGCGQDPLNKHELAYVDISKDLKVLPTMAVVLGSETGEVFEALNLDHPEMALHAEQRLTIFKPLRPNGHLILSERVGAVYDKGKDKGAVVELVVDARYEDENDLCFSMTFIGLARGDGGFGGPEPDPTRRSHPVPDRAPDLEIECPTRPEQALLYSVTGDINPIHIDPDVAAQVGFLRGHRGQSPGQWTLCD